MFRRHHLRLLVAAPLALSGTLLIVGPATAAAETVPVRPGSTPTGLGFWSDGCGTSDANPMVHNTLNADTKSLATSPKLVAGATPTDSAWQLPTSTATEVGPSVSVGKDLRGVSIQALGQVTGRVIVSYGKNFGYYNIDATTPGNSGTGWSTIDLSTAQLRWFKPNPLPIFSNYNDWNFSSGSNAHTLAEFATSGLASGDTALLSVELGCGAAPATFDHFTVIRSGGTTDYDFTNSLSTTSLTASASQVSTGSPVSFTPAVRDNYTHSAPSDGTVQLQAAPSGQRFTDVGDPQPLGATLTATPTTTTTYRVTYSGSLATAASTSAAVTVQIKSKVSATLAPTQVVLGRKYTITGSIKPAVAGATVRLQRLTDGAWKNLATTTTTAGGAYRITRKADLSGAQKVRAYLPSRVGNTAAASSARTLTTVVAGTIAVKASPTRPAPKKKITVSGTITPARSGAKVTLQRQIGKKWSTLASTTTDQAGAYTFTIKSKRPGPMVLRTRVAASGNILAATSRTRTVIVTATTKTSARLSTTSTTLGKAFTVRGRVKPHHATTLVLQRKVNKKWGNIAVTSSSRAGRYSFTTAATATGRWRMRVVLVATSGYRTSRSAAFTLIVKAAPAPTPPPVTSPPTGSGGTGGVGHG